MYAVYCNGSSGSNSSSKNNNNNNNNNNEVTDVSREKISPVRD